MRKNTNGVFIGKGDFLFLSFGDVSGYDVFRQNLIGILSVRGTRISSTGEILSDGVNMDLRSLFKHPDREDGKNE